jgi:hypothetical protein
MPAEHEVCAERSGFGCRRAECFGVSSIVDSDVRTTFSQETHDGQPALAKPDHHRVFRRELHRYLNFNVARLNTASTIAMIQKRTMTRGSGQPFFSKWW